MDGKKPYLSKTLWFNAIVAILALAWPAGQEFVTGNPELFSTVIAGVNILLRFITKDQIKLS